MKKVLLILFILGILFPFISLAKANGGLNAYGWRADYYNGADFNSYVWGQNEGSVNRNWGQGGPGNGIGSDNYSISWHGWFVPSQTGNYTFRCWSDDGCRLDFEHAWDLWYWGGRSWNYSDGSPHYLYAGNYYWMNLQYNEYTGDAAIQFQYLKPDGSAWVDVSELWQCKVIGAPTGLNIQGYSTSGSKTFTWNNMGDPNYYYFRINNGKQGCYDCGGAFAGNSRSVTLYQGTYNHIWMHGVGRDYNNNPNGECWNGQTDYYVIVPAASYAPSPPGAWTAGETKTYNVTVTNTGEDTWTAGGGNPVRLGLHWMNSSGGWITDSRVNLPYDIGPGGSVNLTVTTTAPSSTGSYYLGHQMVKEGIMWYEQSNNPSITVSANNPYGNHEGTNSTNCTTSGWVCDADNFNQAVDIHFYDGPCCNKMIGATTANSYRGDFSSSTCGNTYNHGFTYTLPNSYKDGQTHTVYAYGINIPVGSGPNPLILNNGSSNGISITCPYDSPPTPTITKNSACVNGNYSGSEVTISWTNPTVAVSYVDISTDQNFASYWNKNVSGTTSTNLSGFSSGFYAVPGTTYYVRLYNGKHSSSSSFSIPLCPPTGTITLNPNPCTIAAGKTTCSATARYDFQSAPGGTVLCWNAYPISSDVAGTTFSYNFPQGNHTFYLRTPAQLNNTWNCAGGTVLDSKTLTVNASSGPTPTNTPTPTPIPSTGDAARDSTIRVFGDNLLTVGASSATTPNNFMIVGSGQMIAGSSASLAEYTLPTYEKLRSVYFDQFKPPSGTEKVTLSSSFDSTLINLSDKNRLYWVKKESSQPASGSLIVGKNIAVQKSGVIFVDNDLYINTNLTHSATGAGLIFIVKGNVYVNQNVTEVDALIITTGTFCSSWNGADCVSKNPDSQLLIKGSVISLSADKKPRFVRKITDNYQPAEQLDYQPKYMVIFKDIFAKDLKIWTEKQ